MPRTVPTVPQHLPPDVISPTDYNNGPAVANTFLTSVPIFMGYSASAQLIPNNTNTAIALTAELVDSDSGHSVSTNNTRYTCQVAGWYAISGVGSFASNGTGTRLVAVLQNGFFWTGAVAEFAPCSSGVTCVATNLALVHMAVNDYIELMVFQTSGGSLNTATTTQTSTALSVWWVAAY